MIEKFLNLVDSLSDNMPMACAILLAVLSVILGLALGFGIVMGMAWVTMMVYNALASAFDWPTFSIWFWFGAWTILDLAKKGIGTAKKGE